METIIAALISGIATIVAAWISRQGSAPKPQATSLKTEQMKATTENNLVSSAPKSNTVWWTRVIGLLALLVIFAGFFVSHDLPSLIGLFGIPVVVIILSLIKPAKPWTAAAFIFGVSTIAFLTEFAVKLSRGQSIQLSSGEKWLPFYLLLLCAFYASLGAGICWWKRKKLMHQ